MRDDDEGFTLVELLVAVALLGVVLAAVVSAMLVYLSNGVESTRRDDHSGGAALAASYLERDLASAETVTAGGTDCSGTTNALSLRWTEWTSSTLAPSPAPSGSSWTAAYAVVPSVAEPGRWVLRRWTCGPGAGSRDLLDGLAARSSFTASLGTDPACPGGLVAVSLAGYGTDVGGAHALRGCIGARTP